MTVSFHLFELSVGLFGATSKKKRVWETWRFEFNLAETS
jgi:hypothetical protein